MMNHIFRLLLAALFTLLSAGCTKESAPEPITPDTLPAPPVLLSPEFGTVTGHPLLLRWKSEVAYASYRVQIDSTTAFAAPLIDTTVTGAMSLERTDYEQNAVLYCRVGGVQEYNTRWSAMREFTTRWHLDPPVLRVPADGADMPASVTFDWEPHARTGTFRFRLATDPSFASKMLDSVVAGSNSVTVDRLLGNIDYYWSVGAVIDDTLFWATPRRFRCEVAPPEGYARCTVSFEGFRMLVSRQISGPGMRIMDTISIGLPDTSYTFTRGRAQGMRFDASYQLPPRSGNVAAEWVSPSLLSTLSFTARYRYEAPRPSFDAITEDLMFAIAQKPVSGGVYEVRGASAVRDALSDFSYYRMESFYIITTLQLIRLEPAENARLRVAFE